MKKNTVDLILRFADGQGKIRKNVKINNFLKKYDDLVLQIQYFQNYIFSVDFKLMNGIRTAIQFHLAGIIDLINKKKGKKIIPKLLTDDFHNKIYGLYTELLKFIDAIICDLKSGFNYIDLIALHDKIQYICELYDFSREQHTEDLTITQEMIIDSKLFELFNLYNDKVSSQINWIENNNNWIASVNAVNYPHFLSISNMLDTSNYELNVLRSCPIDFTTSRNTINLDDYFLE
jgi:hypothetical protein